MPSARRREPQRLHRPAVVPVAAVVALVASAIFVVQYVSGAPAIGIGGLFALLGPGILIALEASPSLRRRPAMVLMVGSITLVLMVLVGIAAAMTQPGLTTRTTAGIGQLVLTFAFGAWLVRSRRAAHGGDARSLLLASTPIPTTRVRPRLRSVALALAGVAMAGTGLFIARGAADAQAYAGYLVLWSNAAATSTPPVVGVANNSGATLQCGLQLTRPGATALAWTIDAIQTGGTWEGALPLAASGQRSAWVLDLRCTAPDGRALQRQLRIDPPA